MDSICVAHQVEEWEQRPIEDSTMEFPQAEVRLRVVKNKIMKTKI